MLGWAIELAPAPLHPHPSMGGDASHPLVVAVAAAVRDAGLVVVTPSIADPDVDAAARFVEGDVAGLADGGGSVLVGYSWGAVVASHAAPAGLVGRVLVAPPVTGMALGPDDGVPLLALVPAHDQYGPPDAVAAALADRPAATVEVVEGCDHFLLRVVGRIAERAVAWALVSR